MSVHIGGQVGELSEFKHKVPRRLPGTQQAPLTLYLNHCLWTDAEAGLTKQHVQVFLKSPSEPRGLAFPLVAGWALYPDPSRQHPQQVGPSSVCILQMRKVRHWGVSQGTPRPRVELAGFQHRPRPSRLLWPSPLSGLGQLPGSKVWSMREFTWRPTHSPRG